MWYSSWLPESKTDFHCGIGSLMLQMTHREVRCKDLEPVRWAPVLWRWSSLSRSLISYFPNLESLLPAIFKANDYSAGSPTLTLSVLSVAYRLLFSNVQRSFANLTVRHLKVLREPLDLPFQLHQFTWTREINRLPWRFWCSPKQARLLDVYYERTEKRLSVRIVRYDQFDWLAWGTCSVRFRSLIEWNRIAENGFNWTFECSRAFGFRLEKSVLIKRLTLKRPKMIFWQLN